MLNQDELAQALAARLGGPVRLQRLGGGRNSRVYILSRGREDFCLKVYHRHPADPRDRLGVEHAALEFLAGQGETATPRPVARWDDLGAALHEFLAGHPARPDRDAMEQVVAFVGRLRDLAGRPAAAGLPTASEACFSLAQLEGSLAGRLARFDPAAVPGEPGRRLARFLDGQWRLFRDEALARAASLLAAAGLDPAAPIPAAWRTLSPSDFGFHNAVVRPDGRLGFVDFEYFGWDDPVKLVCDFLLHPAMDLPAPLARRFLDGTMELFAGSGPFPTRLKALYPLWGLKWCLILLNEFVSADLERRGFALDGRAAAERDALLAGQLAKAAAMLERVRATHERFPEDI